MTDANQLVIDDQLLAGLRELYCRGQRESAPPFNIRDALQSLFPSRSLRGQAGLLLFGRRKIAGQVIAFEDALGTMIALQPGFIEFQASLDPGLSGLVSRHHHGQIRVHCVNDYASLLIQPQDHDYPMVIRWALERDDDGTLYIPAERWNLMAPWFDQWLPM